MAEPVQVVQGLYDSLARGDAEAAFETFDEDVEWDGRNFPDGVVGRGRQAVLDHAVRWASIWDDWTIELEELKQVNSDIVIAYIREKGRSDTGVVMDEQHAEVYVVNNDKIVKRVAFSDPAEALPAARDLGLLD